MATMEALLKLRAQVDGEGQIGALNRSIQGLGNTAKTTTGMFRGLTSTMGMGGLAGAMGALTPLLSVAGLVGMAKSSLDAGDAMWDMSQKTGITVESLAKFKKAAATSGTDLETVAKASMKLSKGLLQAANDSKGPVYDGLQALGISAKDAAGKIKSADDVMLEVANKFKTMPDGVEKTALSMKLFGKSGADMIPMLNMGGDAIEKLKVKMTTAFAQKADEYSDKLAVLGGKVGALGMDIVVALLPALDLMVDAITKLVDGFNSLDPGVKNVILGVAALAIAWGPITGIIAAVTGAFASGGVIAGIGATIAGWAGIIGPTVAAITAALGGLLAWIGGTLVPALLGFFSGPIGWTVLAVAAVVAMCIYFREPIMKFFSWLGEAIGKGLEALWKWSEPIRNWFSKLWEGLKKLAYDWFVKPWVDLWNTVKGPVTGFINWIKDGLSKAWQAITGTVKNAFRSYLTWLISGVNRGIGLINRLIDAYNRLPTPDIPRLGMLSVPTFATGGVVSKPTMAMVGEGGEREYIVPESKMAAASAAYLSGARGGAVLSGVSNAQGGGSTVVRPQIAIQTGPVMQMNGQDYVSVGDLEKAMQRTADGILVALRRPANRRMIGVA